MRIVITGTPQPKARPRFSKRGSFVVTYDSQEKQKKLVRKCIQDQLLEHLNSDNKATHLEAGSLCRAKVFHVQFKFYLPINKSDSVSVANRKLWNIISASCKPDYDNLEKFYLDCANGILWNDDAMIVKAQAEKRYDKEPRVEIIVTEKQKLNIHKDVEKIISIISPDDFKRFKDLCTIVSEFPEIDIETINENIYEKWLTATALILSKISTDFAQKLTKISKIGNIENGIKEKEKFCEELEKGDYKI